MKKLLIAFLAIMLLAVFAAPALAANAEPQSLKIEGIPMTSLQALRGQVIVLAANTGKTITYLTGTNYIILSCDGNVWFDPDGTSSLTVPGSDNTAGTGPMLNPTNYLLKVGSRASSGIVAPAATKCSMTEFKVISY